jgi:hypothetical protein
MQKRDYTRWLLYFAFAAAAVIAGFWFTGLMTDRPALALLGACWEFLGALTLVATLLFHQLGLLRLQKQLYEREKAIPTEWVRRFPFWVASRFGPKEPPEGQEPPIESYATLFWGTLLLVFGFLMQAVSQLPWLGSTPMAVTVSSWEAQAWKRWTIGLLFSLIVGHFVIAVSLDFLRYSVGVPKLEAIPASLTGLLERLFFTIVIGVRDVELTSEIPMAMVAWLGLKLAANWNRDEHELKDKSRAGAVSAALAGLVSMLFAFVGGLLCRGSISFGLG